MYKNYILTNNFSTYRAVELLIYVQMMKTFRLFTKNNHW